MNGDESALFLAIVYLFFYFLPAVIAYQRKHHQTAAITILNLFLGWTLLGWIIALVWSATAVQMSEKTKLKWEQN